jgi:hypothetical protein
MGLAESTMSLLDHAWTRTRGRLVGLTDDEYLWEPVAGCWSVRRLETRWFVELEVPAPVPAPITTIAWRTWHIFECLAGMSDRLFNAHPHELDEREWFGAATIALDALDVIWTVFSLCARELDDDAMSRALGDAWGPFASSNRADLLLHAADELIHHGAEIALLRDLYAHRDTR